MSDLLYRIQFYSEWHCGSGLSKGADIDSLVIRDEHGLPYIPGKTLKGLLRDAAETLCELGHATQDTVHTVFGVRAENSDTGSEPGVCFFANAELSRDLRDKLLAGKKSGSGAESPDGGGKSLDAFLFRGHSATAVDADGQAVEHSLRRVETVVPLTLFAKVADVPDNAARELLEKCLKFTKRLGVNRNRGLGRCDMAVYSEDRHDD